MYSHTRFDVCVIFRDYLKNISLEQPHMIHFWKRFVCSQKVNHVRLF